MTQPNNQKTQASAAARWPLLARFIEIEAALAARMGERRSTAALYEFLRFGMKQAWACLFGGLMVALLIGTYLFYPKDALVTRYDFLFLASLAIQAILLITKLETVEEAKVIFAYHVVGTVMEIFKTAVGSWIYPEASIFHIAGVPLFSGFMYSCIGSYLCRAWSLFHLRFTDHPPLWQIGLLSIAIYGNFFSHHYLPDARWILFAMSGFVFWRTRVYFTNWSHERWMPLLAGLILIAGFVWIAENVGTFTHTWRYPHQHDGWSPVSLAKFGSWFLLLIVSYTLVAAIKRPERDSTAPK